MGGTSCKYSGARSGAELSAWLVWQEFSYRVGEEWSGGGGCVLEASAAASGECWVLVRSRNGETGVDVVNLAVILYEFGGGECLFRTWAVDCGPYYYGAPVSMVKRVSAVVWERSDWARKWLRAWCAGDESTARGRVAFSLLRAASGAGSLFAGEEVRS